MTARFECSKCGQEWEDELPPIIHIEAWPNCCGGDAYLMEVYEEDELPKAS